MILSDRRAGVKRKNRAALRGMDVNVKQLSQLYYLKQEIQQYKDRLNDLYTKATSVGQPITGMPRATDITDTVGKCAVDTAYLRVQMEAAIKRCSEEHMRIMAFIDEIPDSLTRQIFTLRFVDCMAWEDVATRIGGNNTGEGVKKRAYRYIKLVPKCPECPAQVC
jgi:predicted  nucleic acid-binding Zn-ribbon protein